MKVLDRVLKWMAFALLALLGLIGTAFAAGSAMEDPGGWRGAGLAAIWLVPAVALALFAWRRPEPSATVLGIVTAAVAVMNIWAALNETEWFAMEDDIGPVRAIVVFALAIPLAVLGVRKRLAAGWMLLVTGALSMLLFTGPGPGAAALRAVNGPIAIAGIMFILSWQLSHHPHRQQDRRAVHAA